jgi:hypothetical protein
MFRNVVLILVLLTLPARANLGETVEQCVKRYGKPVAFSEATDKFPFGTIVFTATGYTLVVFLLNNAEVGARVSKVDKTAFTDAEIQNIMGADSNGTPWTSTTSVDPTTLQWTRNDKATVLYDKSKYMLIFTSQIMADAMAAKP